MNRGTPSDPGKARRVTTPLSRSSSWNGAPQTQKRTPLSADEFWERLGL